MLELDHVFMCVEDLRAAERALGEAGVRSGLRAVHDGQGTANACAAARATGGGPMHPDLVVGKRFPDLEMSDHRRQRVRLSKLADGYPLILSFYRGYW
jgi:hypothetical protein